MSTIPTTGAPDYSTAEECALQSWQVHPARGRIHQTVVVAIVAAFVGCIGFLLLGSVIPAVVMVLALLRSLSDFLLPTTYLLTREAACANSLVAKSCITWASVRRVSVDSRGVRLSAYPNPTVLDGFRSVYLRFAGNRDSVLDVVQKMRASADD